MAVLWLKVIGLGLGLKPGVRGLSSSGTGHKYRVDLIYYICQTFSIKTRSVCCKPNTERGLEIGNTFYKSTAEKLMVLSSTRGVGVVS